MACFRDWSHVGVLAVLWIIRCGVLKLPTRDACCFAPSLPQDGNQSTMMNKSASSVKEYWASVSEMWSFSSISGQEGAFRIPSNLHPLLIQSLGNWMVIFGSLHLDNPWLFLDKGGIAHVFPEGRYRDKMMQKFPSKGWEAECLEKGLFVICEVAVDLCWFVLLHGKKLVLAFQLQRPQDKSRKGNRELCLGCF